MAQALARGFVRTGALSPDRIGACARDAAKLRRNTEPHGFRAFDCAGEVATFADVVVVAVKPHQVETVVVPIRERLAGRIVVSVAAGVTFDDYERMLLPGTAHLSTVPNTPVAVGEGIIACERRASLSEAPRAAVDELLSPVVMPFRVDPPLGEGACSSLSSVRNRYRTRSVRPMRSTVVGLMPFRAQIFFTVVPYFTARCPSVSPERILW